MDREPKLNFRKEVLKALQKGIITKEETKECLKRGLKEIPIFLFSDNENKPYFLALEKIGIIQPLIRLDGSFPE